MKKFLLIVIFLFLLSFGISAQEFTTIANGIEYAKFTRKIKDEPINVNLLRLDLTKVRLDVVHALDSGVGLETTSSIATRHNAIAAINAGFFKMTGVYQGDPSGVLQIDGKLLSESYGNRIAMFISNNADKTDINFAHLDIEHSVFIGKNSLEISGVNRQRGKDEIVLFTPEFHRTTLTDQTGTEVIVKKGKVVGIAKSGSNLIPPDGFVLSASGNKQEILLKSCKIGPKTGIQILRNFVDYDEENEQKREEERQKRLSQINDKDFEKTEDIVGGVPQLIKSGKIEITWQEEKVGKEFVETRHPRTAVAKLKDGKFLLVAVDGRQPNVSVGMNLQELSEMLLEFGAIEAMNLDGGGSTTMFVKDKIVNIPSDKTGERPVSDAILVTLRR
jgi:exopolysaccharide biosynthesis protein